MGMFHGIFNETTVPVLQQVVQFNQARQNVLAGNIANIDSPNYKARDLDTDGFRKQLRSAIKAKHEPPSGIETNYPYDSQSQMQAGELKKHNAILRHDENNIGIEYEVSEMIKNQLEFNTCLSLMRHQMTQLQTAISERV